MRPYDFAGVRSRVAGAAALSYRQAVDRLRLLELLDCYAPCSREDEAARERVYALIAGHPSCFSRTRREGHVTASAWVIDEACLRAVLVRHRKLRRWLQPGGHADGDVDLVRVAQREIAEETGLRRVALGAETIFDVDVHEIPANDAEPAHLHYDVRFLFLAPAGARLVCSDESTQVAWFTREDIERLDVDASVRRMVEKSALGGRR